MRIEKSWLFKWANGLLINNVLLHKLGKIPSDKCDFCEKQDSRSHTLHCESTKSINYGILRVIQTCTENKSSTSDIEILDLNVPASLQLPALFIFSETLQQVPSPVSQELGSLAQFIISPFSTRQEAEREKGIITCRHRTNMTKKAL